ncbi:hypothetical protein [Undibacterium crateris]|uniref:hypothetical protein n=1 Tax=Undibacterium crateris TaxID=2528175 RepID=UPI00138A27AE|nr:hypothetical protein [Undibacterium crateris]NDI85283.1 hypothetical protein [Undibacterium crateris]
MKSTTKNNLILSIALFAGVAAVSQAFTVETRPAQSEIQTVSIVAKRMSEQEKIAFDTESAEVQQVIVAARRMNAEEKIAFDQQFSVNQTLAQKSVNGKAI